MEVYNVDNYSSPSKDERMWAMLCHVSTFLGYLLPLIGQVIPPLLIWLIKRDSMPFVDDQGKEALNFQISLLLYTMIAGLLVIVAIGFVFLLIIPIAHFILTIIAAIRSNEGVYYRYPLTIRLIR
ncbi:DUF4870 domain-containing protein [Heliorestis acidaminivorans]|uniref:DUF4870 domain-containing protein n=1 Tax=Heliorestis acidaminivorans TaxID=553427 RepID=A0A6I0EQC2_9FIRM|nr:DUF4870 domain-containing protein [Heliorestis acidaminivorans]KAB2952314.1 DUF4870 domain-containing protein [Heliorestis acidaminivorans]